MIGRELDVSLPRGSSILQLRDRLAADHPAAEQVLRSRRARTCIGDTLVHDDHVLEGAETVEFLPPVSGG